MNTNLKELLDETKTKEERDGLMQMIQRMLVLRQMSRIRSSEDNFKQK